MATLVKEWTRLLGSPSSDEAFSVSNAGDEIYIAGRTAGDLDGQPNSGGYDAFLSQYRSYASIAGSQTKELGRTTSLNSRARKPTPAQL